MLRSDLSSLPCLSPFSFLPPRPLTLFRCSFIVPLGIVAALTEAAWRTPSNSWTRGIADEIANIQGRCIFIAFWETCSSRRSKREKEKEKRNCKNICCLHNRNYWHLIRYYHHYLVNVNFQLINGNIIDREEIFYTLYVSESMQI